MLHERGGAGTEAHQPGDRETAEEGQTRRATRAQAPSAGQVTTAPYRLHAHSFLPRDAMHPRY